MKQFKNRIITASAGTGKTYRLAVEYIRILLEYYNAEGFSPDNILVLTFTRKATAEIRERIIGHISLLLSDKANDQDKRMELLDVIRTQGGQRELNDAEKMVLEGSLNRLSIDRKQLQVMTIDSYINSIFRNIVRPLRSIDRFEIDLQAVEKRLPFLMQHLLDPSVKSMLDSLLKRKVTPSLDEYKDFFISLVQQRWLKHLIDKLHSRQGASALELAAREETDDSKQARLEECMELFGRMVSLIESAKPDKDPEELIKKSLRDLLSQKSLQELDLSARAREFCRTSQRCHMFFKAISDGNIYNAGRIKGKGLEEQVTQLAELQEQLRGKLADYLMLTLFLPEQEEILDLWGTTLAEYDKLIYKYKNMTYDDVAWFSLEALFSEEPPLFDLSNEVIATEFYQFLSHRSRFILIDEFQDTSLMQFAILKPILEEVCSGQGSKDFGGMIVVGDEKQSIFGWRGGERELLRKLPVLIPSLRELQIEDLDDSYRSSPGMMKFINAVFQDKGLHQYLAEQGQEWDYRTVNSARPELEHLTQLEVRTISYGARGEEDDLHAVFSEFVQGTVIKNYDEDKQESVAILCRKTNELTEIQQVLQEATIANIFQPTSLLTEHPWVAPLINWLRFLAWRDWLDFLAVLRSNYIMLKAAPLKAVVDSIDSSGGQTPDLSAIPLAAALLKLADGMAGSLAGACQDFVDICLKGKELHERDYLNINAFLTLANDYELSTAQRDKSIPGFLDYLDDNKEQEFLKQVAVEGSEELQLLTIHKSKGLQFDRVFLFFNLSGGSGSDWTKLKWFFNYDKDDLQKLSDYALTYHYEDLLKHSSFKYLPDSMESRENLEELNNLYVAFTRAKTALHICFAYRGGDDWGSYLTGREDKGQVELPHLLCDASLRHLAAFEGAESLGSGVRWRSTLPAPDEASSEEKEQPQKINLDDLAAALPEPDAGLEPEAVAPDSPAVKDWKKIWIEDRHNLFGNLVHYYLSFIKKNLDEEHERALRQCLAFYGSLLTHDEIVSRIELLRASLAEHGYLFEPRWDKVFTEFSLYLDGREKRLDRLMLDTQAKEALILDYKTGKSMDASQLGSYEQALAGVRAISEQGYTISSRFVILNNLGDLEL
ncbi:MAG TPA: UvrD-helicase domain-containing protein [Candidatus Cloacimonadota bacterium]|nr:UvrD-helicase domain-containing protein [Candidatus Cloacimonadota bacterium]